MRLHNRFTALFLCLLLFLAGCSSSTLSSTSGKSVKTITLDTKGIPGDLTIYVNEEPQPNKTNNGEVKLSVPKDQDNLVYVKNEKPEITYQVEIPQGSEETVSLKINPAENKVLNQEVADFLGKYFKAVNLKKNAQTFLSKGSIFDPKNIYKTSYKSAVLYTTSFEFSMMDAKPELIVLVDTETPETPSYTRTYEFRLIWEDGSWKIFHQRVLYEVLNGKLLFESEKGTYPGEQTPGPDDIKLSF